MKLLKDDNIELEKGKTVFIFSEGSKNFLEIGHGGDIIIHQEEADDSREAGIYAVVGSDLIMTKKK